MRITAIIGVSISLTCAYANADTSASSDTSALTPTPSPASAAPMIRTTAQGIPYQSQPYFAENRVAGCDVKLPPLPSSLFAIPPAEHQPSPVMLPPLKLTPPAQNNQSASTNPGGKFTSGTSGSSTDPKNASSHDESEENVAVSPFINWISNTPNAADIARSAQKEYAASGTNTENSANAKDLFLNIRFPYLGNEQIPTGGSAVIYSTPKR